jgi:hypothetical protein
LKEEEGTMTMKLLSLQATEDGRYALTVEAGSLDEALALFGVEPRRPGVPTREAPAPAQKPAQAAPAKPEAPKAKLQAVAPPGGNGALASAPTKAAKLKAAPVVADDEEEAEEGAGEGLPAEVAEAKRLIDVLNYFQDQGVSGADALVAALTEHRSRIGLIGRIPADLLVERVERALATFGR